MTEKVEAETYRHKQEVVMEMEVVGVCKHKEVEVMEKVVGGIYTHKEEVVIEKLEVGICIGMLEVKPSTGVVIYSGRVDIKDKEEDL